MASKRYVMDMTEGNISRILLKFSVPLLIGNIFQQVYNIVDSIVVGKHLGEEALGGVGSVGMISFLFFSLCNGLMNGMGVIVAKYFGAREQEKVQRTIANAIYVVLVAGTIMSLLGFFCAKPVLHLMNTPAENFDYAYKYMRITCGLTIIVAMYNGISAILRALGDSRTPLMFLIVASVINVILDLLFVVHLEWGVEGAALATVISQFVSAMGSIIFSIFKNPYFKLCREHFKPNAVILKETLHIGIPMGLQTALISISCSILQTLINGHGTKVMAAYTATGKVESIVVQPFNSLGAAVSTFAGQNFGAHKFARIKQAVKRAELMVIGFSAAVLLAIVLLRFQIIGAFIDSADTVAIGARALLITGSMYFALGSINVFRSALNGMGDVFFSMVNGAMEVSGRIGFALILMNIAAIGYYGVWLTNGMTWMLIATWACLRFIVFMRKTERGNKTDAQSVLDGK